MRSLAWLVLLAGCSQTRVPPVALPHDAAPAAPAPAGAKGAKTKPAAPVLLVVVVDQLGSWVFEQRRPSFEPDGGFSHLLHEGVYAPQLRYEHATTSTAPGHAALYTGLPPRGSGVFANERLDMASGQAVSVYADATTREVQDTPLESESSSASRLRAATLADALRAQRPDAEIISLSLKDRAAIPGGGKRPDAAIWFDTHQAAFVSSSAFAKQVPAFVQRENQSLPQLLAGSWKPLDSAWLQAHAPVADARAGESDYEGLGIQFPYELTRAKKPANAFRSFPASDAALFDLARGALDQLHPEASPDKPLLLALSLSEFDYVGHLHGANSWESWEALRELDRALGTFVGELERRFGSRLSVMLSADHGTSLLPESAGDLRARPWCKPGAGPDPYQRPCDKGQRLIREELEQQLQKAARSALGPGDFIRSVVEPFVYFTPAVSALPAARRKKLEAASVAALQKLPGVARVLISRTFTQPCPPASDDSLEALVCRSLDPDAGDLYIATQPGSFFDPGLLKGTGLNHGSPYLYDRTVPLLVMSHDHGHAGQTLTSPVRPADFTATAAALLGIQPPAGASDGRNLTAP